jgi:hypothetical protein
MINSSEEFVALRRSQDYRQYQRAAHDSAPEEVWIDVINNYPDMKEWVVHNKTVPVSILRMLAGDPDSRVRFAVATKRKCDRHIFCALSMDPDPSVRLRVAFNRKTPIDILETLLNDKWDRVVEVATERLEEQKRGRRGKDMQFGTQPQTDSGE